MKELITSCMDQHPKPQFHRGSLQKQLCGKLDFQVAQTHVTNLCMIRQYKYSVLQSVKGMANGKSETRRDAKTGILKSETEMEEFSDLIEKYICDQQTQNLRLGDSLLCCARFRDLGRICRDFSIFRGPYSPPLVNVSLPASSQYSYHKIPH